MCHVRAHTCSRMWVTGAQTAPERVMPRPRFGEVWARTNHETELDIRIDPPKISHLVPTSTPLWHLPSRTCAAASGGGGGRTAQRQGKMSKTLITHTVLCSPPFSLRCLCSVATHVQRWLWPRQPPPLPGGEVEGVRVVQILPLLRARGYRVKSHRKLVNHYYNLLCFFSL